MTSFLPLHLSSIFASPFLLLPDLEPRINAPALSQGEYAGLTFFAADVPVSDHRKARQTEPIILHRPSLGPQPQLIISAIRTPPFHVPTLDLSMLAFDRIGVRGTGPATPSPSWKFFYFSSHPLPPRSCSRLSTLNPTPNAAQVPQRHHSPIPPGTSFQHPLHSPLPSTFTSFAQRESPVAFSSTFLSPFDTPQPKFSPSCRLRTSDMLRKFGVVLGRGWWGFLGRSIRDVGGPTSFNKKSRTKLSRRNWLGEELRRMVRAPG
ncbi:hypothetical protein FA13DRAFT_1706115 [Coprinellus micaceus]|uniref:Uncharacterized protein n=1 Tax=Coprinellus micaceus TaxID=71717 RepID=A0A4Y7TRX2_COPMI|nr:hypothetical protein FA13DRAFT_1706115 [Coprinellus micaceus]